METSRNRLAHLADRGYMPAMTPVDSARYINLESFKKNGDGVKTPVWHATLDDKVVLFSEGQAFKVKRVRNNPRVRVAECDVRGKVLGPWYEGTAKVVDDPGREAAAYKALRQKYGWQMGILDFFSGLAGKKKKRAVLEIALNS
jgi:PPOX class probable F420-dependent enzyme